MVDRDRAPNAGTGVGSEGDVKKNSGSIRAVIVVSEISRIGSPKE